MVVLGLIILALAVGFGVDVVAQNGQHVQATVLAQTISHASLGGVFLAGAVAALVALAGLALATAGLRRARRRRRLRRAGGPPAAASSPGLPYPAEPDGPGVSHRR